MNGYFRWRDVVEAVKASIVFALCVGVILALCVIGAAAQAQP